MVIDTNGRILKKELQGYLDTSYSKDCPGTSSISITWVLLEIQNLILHPELLNQNLHLKRTSDS
jgi:hypothetical protein